METKINFLTIIFLVAHISFGVTYTSIADGDWDDETFWDKNGAPTNILQKGDVVIVNHKINITEDIDIAGILTINQNAILTTNSAKKIKSITGTLMNNGTIEIKQITEVSGHFTNTNVISLEGELNFNGNSALIFTNSGTLKATKFRDEGKGYPEGINTSIFSNTGLIAVHSEFKFDGFLTNEGILKAKKLHINGELCNKGTVSAAEVYLLGGNIRCKGSLIIEECSNGNNIRVEVNNERVAKPSIAEQNLCCNDNITVPIFDFRDELDGNIIDSTTFQTCNVFLPVKWGNVKGIVEKSDVKLVWSTMQEINNAYFEIEKSVDGDHFITVGEIKGGGNTNKLAKYEYYDYDIFNDVYYRVKQIDSNGKYSYSKAIHVISSYSNHHITVYPNTAHHYLNIIGELDIHDMKIVDADGNEYYSKEDFNLYEGLHIELNDLNISKGTYFIHLPYGNKNIVEKVVFN